MTSRDHLRSVGVQQASAIVRAIGTEIRSTRIAAGVTQRALAARAGISREQLCRLELGRLASVDMRTATILFALLGLRMSVKGFPSGEPMRDAGQLRLLARFEERIPPPWTSRREVPMPIPGDRRAWDELISGPVRIGVEAETRPRDLQGTQRSLGLKKRDGGVDRVALLLASTPHNEALVRANIATLRQAFPLDTRAFFAAMNAGRDPGADALLLV